MLILDAHLSPGLAPWISETFGIECYSATYLGLRDALDTDIFVEARTRRAIVVTKDEDFVELFSRLGSPPKIVWLTCGNTSKQRLKVIFQEYLQLSIQLLENTDLVEITG
jgi:predicted nuclease of predicted toxin-antitoxin system